MLKKNVAPLRGSLIRPASFIDCLPPAAARRRPQAGALAFIGGNLANAFLSHPLLKPTSCFERL